MNGLNPLLARLQNEVVFVAPDREAWFETCLRSIFSHKHAEELTAPTDTDSFASSEDDGFWPPKDDWRSNYRPYVVKGGVLHIPVMGVLLNRFPWQLGQWATGYTYIYRAMIRGLEDPEVKKIAFVCDSPGGEASGNLELADQIFNRRGEKPMMAFANDRAFSAAYAVACSADKITMTRTGGVGSIGAYTLHIDYSEALSMAGIKVTFVKYGAMKTAGNPYEKLSRKAEQRIQMRIDRLGELFVGVVARNRGLDEQAVRDTEADCFGPEEAIEIGLADQMEVFEDAMIAYTEDGSSSDGEDNMTTPANATVKPGEQNPGGAKVLTQADLDAAVLAAVEKTKLETMSEAQKTAYAAAQTRMTAILGCDAAKKRPKAAMAVVQKMPDMTVEQASAFLLSLPEEAAPTTEQAAPKGGATGALFSAAMQGSQHPDLGAGDKGQGGQGEQATDDDLASQILADQHAATGYGKARQKAA